MTVCLCMLDLHLTDKLLGVLLTLWLTFCTPELDKKFDSKKHWVTWGRVLLMNKTKIVHDFNKNFKKKKITKLKFFHIQDDFQM